MNLKVKLLEISEYFSPKIIGEVNDIFIKLVKIKGSKVPWHNHKILKVTKSGAVRWKSYYWVYISAALKGKYIAIQELGNGIWKVYYRNVFLGFFDQRNLRKKQQATRLETNVV